MTDRVMKRTDEAWRATLTPSDARGSYACPRDRAALAPRGDGLFCAACGRLYPIVRGVPVLIDDETSVFSTASYLGQSAYLGASYGSVSDRASGLRRRYRRFAKRLSDMTAPICSLDAAGAVQRIRAERSGGRILVVGAGDAAYEGDGLVYTDVAFGGCVSCICDAHALPYPDGHFDGVLAVAVLEHVADPWRCVGEIRRVLKPKGLVYAATPFLQPVHMGAHDFTRFTYLGHRRLFRDFDDVESGPALGPCTAAALALQAVLVGASPASFHGAARLLGLLAAVPLKQMDRLYRGRAGAYDAAAGVFFYGRKRETPISDKDLLRLYRGLQ